MKTALQPDEVLVKEGAANMQRGIETVGGRLYLTNQRLVFETHDFNIQTGTTIVALQDVASVRKCWTRFLNLIPMFPNSIAVATNDWKEHRFVVFGRQAWIDAIESAKT